MRLLVADIAAVTDPAEQGHHRGPRLGGDRQFAATFCPR
jgi:hypothetical protein